jgi:hypothetical protein
MMPTWASPPRGSLLSALRMERLQSVHPRAEVERPRLTLARVPERVHAAPVGRRDRHLDRLLDAVPVPGVLDEGVNRTRARSLRDATRSSGAGADAARRAVRHVHGGGAGSASTQSALGHNERRAEHNLTVLPTRDLT